MSHTILAMNLIPGPASAGSDASMLATPRPTSRPDAQSPCQLKRYTLRRITLALYTMVELTAAAVPYSTCSQRTASFSRIEEKEPPALYEIATNEGLSLEDLLQALGWLELKALSDVKHGDLPPTGEVR
jgi:hypothetical protein